jgi:hypothetical protein
MGKNQETIHLPNLTPSVTLPLHLAHALQQTIEAGPGGASSIDLSTAGCMSPSRYISDLKKRGALISTELRDAEDSSGSIHPRVAHYTYCGWRYCAEIQLDTSHPDKDTA